MLFDKAKPLVRVGGKATGLAGGDSHASEI
jgi:hypothetical protein